MERCPANKDDSEKNPDIFVIPDISDIKFIVETDQNEQINEE